MLTVIKKNICIIDRCISKIKYFHFFGKYDKKIVIKRNFAGGKSIDKSIHSESSSGKRIKSDIYC